jgi:PKD repeat protein
VKKTIVFAAAFFFALSLLGQTAKDYTIALKLDVQYAPYSFSLSWKGDTTAIDYKVYTKQPDQLFWTERAKLTKYDSAYTDTAVAVGVATEYQLVKTMNSYVAYGYILAAQQLDNYGYRGKLLLLADSNYQTPLAAEIAQLQTDLTGDGWQVITRYIPRTATPPMVKQHIVDLWAQDSINFKSVYLLGRIAVPYSGYIGPDGHPDHYGAWPADLYYSVVDNTQWTDFALNVKYSSSSRNYNVPGDGKFDLDYIVPGSAKLQVGRVDLNTLPTFPGMSDTALIQRYLAKAHNFKVNNYSIPLRSLIDDNFGAFGGEAFARTGWNSFPAMFGDSVRAADYVNEMKARPYMFSYGCGDGSYTSCSGVVNNNNFANDSLVSPFTAYFGSYFGDWDISNNLMRVGLGSRSIILAAMWSGRPVYYYHQMALGQTIGYCATISANSTRSLYHSDYSSNGVHMALLGDPSLRLHPITPASNPSASATCNNITVKWINSTDTGIFEHRIYRAASADGRYELIGSALTDSFVDAAPLLGDNYYMVRAARLQHTPSGTYFNTSLGVMANTNYQPVPKPVIWASDTALCLVGNRFVLRNGVSNFALAYTQSWRIDGQPVTYNDSIEKIFTNAGSYAVSFAVSNNSGCYDSIGQMLVVNDMPSADIIYLFEGQCSDSNSVKLTTNTVGVDYEWVFSDDDTLRIQNPTKSFKTSGNYSVTLTTKVQGTGCSNSKSDNIVIQPKPSPVSINGNPFMQLGRDYVYTVSGGSATSTYTWSVSQTPDFMQVNDDTLKLRWDNGLRAAVIKVVERDSLGCKGDTAYFTVWTIIDAVDEINSSISVYPVPTSNSDVFIFNHNTAIEGAVVKVIDASGRQVLSIDNTLKEGENRIDISTLSAGVYYLHLLMGDKQSTHKIIKLDR